MLPLTEAEKLRLAALAYVIDLYNELTQENGAPPLGSQNQAIDFILGDLELCRALAAWAADAEIGEATLTLRRLPRDALYHRVRTHLDHIKGPGVFPTAKELAR